MLRRGERHAESAIEVGVEGGEQCRAFWRLQYRRERAAPSGGAFFTLWAGSVVSAAARDIISVQPNANATTNSAVAIPPKPPGANPSPMKLIRPGDCTPGIQPKSRAAPTSRNPTIAATLSRTNQNSQSPKFFTLVRFTAVSTTMNTKAIDHTGRAGKMVASRPAAPLPWR